MNKQRMPYATVKMRRQARIKNLLANIRKKLGTACRDDATESSFSGGTGTL